MTTAIYKTTTEHAAEIRAALKAAGIKASVRCLSGSIYVRVQAGAVRAAATIAKDHESISRDERTGEILCGGNRFVNVAAADELVDALAAPIRAAAAASYDEAKAAKGSTIFPIAGTTYGVGWNSCYSSAMVWSLGPVGRSAGHGCLVNSGEATARCVASNLADGEG